MKYKEQRNTITGETRWVPVEEQQEKKPWLQRTLQTAMTGDIPIVSDFLGSVVPAATGLMTRKMTPKISEQSDKMFESVNRLIEQSKIEQDPAKKQELLQQSKELAQQARQLTGDYTSAVETGMGRFAEPEFSKKPTDTLLQKIGAYAPAAGRTATAIGTALLPGTKTIAGKAPTGKLLQTLSGGKLPARAAAPLSRIFTKSAITSTVFSAKGFVEGDDATFVERLNTAKGEAKLGAAIGAVFGVGNEAMAWKNSGGFGKLAKNLNLPKKWLEGIERIGKETKVNVNNKTTKELMRKEAQKLPSGIKENVMKRIDKEVFDQKTLWEVIEKKRGAGYAPNLKSAQYKYNEILRRTLKNMIHNVSDDVAKADKRLWKYYRVAGPVKDLAKSKLMRIIGVGKILEAILR